MTRREEEKLFTPRELNYLIQIIEKAYKELKLLRMIGLKGNIREEKIAHLIIRKLCKLKK